MLLWPDRPAVRKFISGVALFEVKKLHLICLELSFYWRLEKQIPFSTLHVRGVCMCCRIGFQEHAISVQELLLFLVLNRISRNLSSLRQSSSLLSYFDSLCFLFFLYL